MATIGTMTARGSEEQIPDPRRLVALLADPGRLRVFAALVLAPRQGAQPQELAKTANVPVRDVIKALIRLDDAGLAAAVPDDADPDREADRWRAVPEALRAATGAARRGDDALPPEPVVQDAGTLSVLRGFFAGGRLTHVPAAHAKRMIVLDYLAQSFEPGVRYKESKVNQVLGGFHDDYAALRRYLVDEGFLSRSENVYWRTGGSTGL